MPNQTEKARLKFRKMVRKGVVGAALAVGASVYLYHKARPYSHANRNRGGSPFSELLSARSPPGRGEQWGRLERQARDGIPWDVVVVGGGLTGTAVALEARIRGLSVCLLEQGDFGSGSSTQGSKILDGGSSDVGDGITRLNSSDISRGALMAKDRDGLMHAAPHLHRVVPMLEPIYSWKALPTRWLESKVHDFVSGKVSKWGVGGMWPSRLVSPERCRQFYPFIKAEGLKCCMLRHDALFDDARLVLAMASTAAKSGGCLVNYAEVTGVVKGHRGKVVGVRVENGLPGASRHVEVRGRVVINCSGANSELLIQSDQGKVEGGEEKQQWRSGSVFKNVLHTRIVLGRTATPVIGSAGVPCGVRCFLPSGVLEIVPWMGRSMVGTVATPLANKEDDSSALATEMGGSGMISNLKAQQLQQSHPVPNMRSVATVMKRLGECLEVSEVGEVANKDVDALQCEVRPVYVPNTDPSAQGFSLPTKVLLGNSDGGLLTVVNPSPTLCRLTAREAIDAAIEAEDLQGKAVAPPAKYPHMDGILLDGANDSSEDGLDPAAIAAWKLGRKYTSQGLKPSTAERLGHIYGSGADQVAELASATAFAPLALDGPFSEVLQAEVEVGLRELGGSPLDILFRRVRVGSIDVAAAEKALPLVVSLMATRLGWDKQRQDLEVQKALHQLDLRRLSKKK